MTPAPRLVSFNATPPTKTDAQKRAQRKYVEKNREALNAKERERYHRRKAA